MQKKFKESNEKIKLNTNKENLEVKAAVDSIFAIKTPKASKIKNVSTTDPTRKGLKVRDSNIGSEPAEVLDPSPAPARKESRIPKLKSGLKTITIQNSKIKGVIIDENKNMQYYDKNLHSEYDDNGLRVARTPNSNRVRNAGVTPGKSSETPDSIKKNETTENIKVKNGNYQNNNSDDAVAAIALLISQSNFSPSDSDKTDSLTTASAKYISPTCNAPSIDSSSQKNRKLLTPHATTTNTTLNETPPVRREAHITTMKSPDDLTTTSTATCPTLPSSTNQPMSMSQAQSHSQACHSHPLSLHTASAITFIPHKLDSNNIPKGNELQSRDDYFFNPSYSASIHITDDRDEGEEVPTHMSVPLKTVGSPWNQRTSPKCEPTSHFLMASQDIQNVTEKLNYPSKVTSKEIEDASKSKNEVLASRSVIASKREEEIKSTHTYPKVNQSKDTKMVEDLDTNYDELVSSIAKSKLSGSTALQGSHFSPVVDDLSFPKAPAKQSIEKFLKISPECDNSDNSDNRDHLMSQSRSNGILNPSIKRSDVTHHGLNDSHIYASKSNTNVCSSATHSRSFPWKESNSTLVKEERHKTKHAILEISSSPNSGIGEDPSRNYPEIGTIMGAGQNILDIETGGVSLFRPSLVRGSIPTKIGDRIVRPEEAVPHMMSNAINGYFLNCIGSVGEITTVEMDMYRHADAQDECNISTFTVEGPMSQYMQDPNLDIKKEQYVEMKGFIDAAIDTQELCMTNEICTQFPSVHNSFEVVSIEKICGQIVSPDDEIRIDISTALEVAKQDIESESIIGGTQDDSNAEANSQIFALSELLGTPHVHQGYVTKGFGAATSTKGQTLHISATKIQRNSTPVNSTLGKAQRVIRDIDEEIIVESFSKTQSSSSSSVNSDITSSVIEHGKHVSNEWIKERQSERACSAGDFSLEVPRNGHSKERYVLPETDKAMADHMHLGDTGTSIREIVLTGKPNSTTSVTINLKNKKHVVMTDVHVSIILVRVDGGTFDGSAYNNNANIPSTPSLNEATQVFQIYPNHLSIAPKSDISLYVQFSPPRTGIYTGVIKIKSKQKVGRLYLPCIDVE